MKLTEITSYLDILKSLGGGKEQGVSEAESSFSLPYPSLEALANLGLALHYAPRDKQDKFLPLLPSASVTPVDTSSFSLNLVDFPGKTRTNFSLLFRTDPKSNFGVSISPESNTPAKVKATLFTLEHLPLPAKLKPKITIKDSGLTISGISYSLEENAGQDESVTLETLVTKLGQISHAIQANRPNFQIEVVGTKSKETPIMVVAQTDGIFSLVKIGLVLDQSRTHGYRVISQAYPNPDAKFATNPHALELSRRLESVINCLFLPLLYPTLK